MDNFVAIPFRDYKKFAAAICEKAGEPDSLELNDLMQMVSPPSVGLVPTAWDESGYITKARFYGETVPDYLFSAQKVGGTQPGNRLTEVDLKDVTTVGERAFAANSSLSSVKNTDSITVIGDYAFSSCPIEQWSFPRVREIGTQAFSANSALVDLVLPASLERIGQHAFAACSNLKTVRFLSKPSALNLTFHSCGNITDVYVPWSEEDGPGGVLAIPNTAIIHYNSPVEEA